MFFGKFEHRTGTRCCLAAAVLILVPLFGLAHPPAPADADISDSVVFLHQTIFRALVVGDFPQAAKHLPDLALAAPRLSRALHHGYLKGVLLEEAGDLVAARDAYLHYLDGRGEDALLAPYAHLRLAVLEEKDRKPAAAAGNYHQAAAAGRRWPYQGEALIGGVRCAAAAGDCGETARILRLLDGRRRDTLSRQGGVLLAQCLINAGERHAGRRRLQLLLGENQGDDPALSAYQLLSGPGGAPEEAEGVRSMFSSAREEAWCMGNAAYRNRQFDDAIHWLEQLVDASETGDDAYQDKAIFLIGRCRLLQGDFTSARQWFLLAGEKFPKSLSGQDGLYFNAVCHLRVGNDEAALEVLQRLAGPKTRSTVALKAVITAVWPLKNSLDAAGLDQLVDLAAELGGSRSIEAGILMHLADVQRRSGEIQTSMITLGRVISLSDRDDAIHAEAALWLARHLAEAGRIPEMLQQCLYVSKLDVAYLFRNEAREMASRQVHETFADQDQVMIQGARNLVETDDHAAARQELEKFLLTCGWSDKRQVVLNLLQELYRREVPYSIPFWIRPILPADLEQAAGRGKEDDGLRRAAALLRIGRFGEAAAELEASGGRETLDRYDRQYAIALWSMMGADKALSVRAAERLTETLPPSAVLEALPLNIRLLLYPGHFFDLVSREAEKRDLDPLLVLAVLREESRFGSGVRSGASARGLMQILPETAVSVSERYGIDYAGSDDLYRPEVSIAIGCAYLASLVQRYQGNVAVALSAYNGGEANADRWLAAASDPADPFDYIREVTFNETRNYVIKVLSSHRAYQAHGTKLVGHTAEIVGSFVDWDLFSADLPAAR